ncbi:nucleotidyltransferase family protein [Steroidobacter cummioxidans]|uniref:nucleotidyltransferase family protein n=1 Tax=Steroidobacter cummioxidans TaxID=1803913 RepID=UPI000E318A36|nr:nucleotidyltransferase family protein [Steroidobacter cummioxidans]
MKESDAIPAPKVLQQALRSTTETLAAELASPGSVAPEWSELQWQTARAVAAIHGVSALLASRLRWSGPAEWQCFLRQQREHTLIRHGRMQQLLQALDVSLKQAAIPAVTLKGAELYAIGLYEPGERPMGDLDLLVRGPDVERATAVLHSLGFRESYPHWKHQAFVPEVARTPGPLGEHADNDIKIELHERVCERLPLDEIDISQIVFPARPHVGLNAYPSKAALITHLLLHAAGAMMWRGLRLMHLHDLALLCSRMTESDWTHFMSDAAGGPGVWWAMPPLALTAHYYPHAVPKHLLAIVAADCRWVLRRASRQYRLSDVSLSRLHIEAFPGIEWAQSLPEAFRYAVKRVRPDEEARAVYAHIVSYEAWASNSPWFQLPHYRRALRWVTSRPTRQATMHAVRAAFRERL